MALDVPMSLGPTKILGKVQRWSKEARPPAQKRATREFLFPGPGTSAEVLAFGITASSTPHRKRSTQRVFRFYANLRMAPRLRLELVTFYFNILEMKGAFALKGKQIVDGRTLKKKIVEKC